MHCVVSMLIGLIALCHVIGFQVFIRSLTHEAFCANHSRHHDLWPSHTVYALSHTICSMQSSANLLACFWQQLTEAGSVCCMTMYYAFAPSCTVRQSFEESAPTFAAILVCHECYGCIGGGGSSGSATLDRLMEQIPFGPKPKIVDLTSDRKLADKVWSSQQVH